MCVCCNNGSCLSGFDSWKDVGQVMHTGNPGKECAFTTEVHNRPAKGEMFHRYTASQENVPVLTVHHVTRKTNSELTGG